MSGSDERHLNIIRKKIQSATGGYTGIRQKASDSLQEVMKQIRLLENSKAPLSPDVRMATHSLLQSTMHLARQLGVEVPSDVALHAPSNHQANQKAHIEKKTAHLWMATPSRKSPRIRIERLLTKRAPSTQQGDHDWPEE